MDARINQLTRDPHIAGLIREFIGDLTPDSPTRQRRHAYLQLLAAVGSGAAAYAVRNYLFGNKSEKKILPSNNMVFKRKPSYTRRYKKRSFKKSSAKYSQQTNTGQRVSSKRVYRKTKPKTSLKKQIKQIQKSLKSDQAFHTHKRFYGYSRTSGVGLCQHYEHDINAVNSLEAVMAYLRYYDPSVPGTLTTANAASGTYSRQVHFKNVYSRMDITNNFQVPCKVKVYLVKPKGDTNILPLTYYANGIADQVIYPAGADKTTASIYLTDIDVFNAQYSSKLMKDIILQPGATTYVSHSTGSFDYDPSVYDSHSLAYQPKFKCALWVIRVEGILGHDTAASERGILAAGVDTTQYEKYEIVYDAGVNLNDIYCVDNRAATFTNGGVVSQKPIPDNVGYSVS